MKRIKYLPGSVHSFLRSSVFLFDLTRVVEELVLNSLDASATKVKVYVNVGACYVKVEDNGFGVTRDGLVLLGEKYATSKLQNHSNMDDNIESLSPRGEALSSLSDISLLEVITKARGRPNAYRKVMKGRKCLFLGIEHRQDVGTTVIVRDLFYNQPVRRRSMQSSPQKVLHSVKKCLVCAALVHPQVSFSVLDLESENELLHTLPSPSPLPLLSNNFGSDISDRLHKVSYADKELELSGYLTGPADTSSVKAFQYLYINSRFVCRGPVHKLINNLASSFCLSLNYQRSESEFHNGKRQRTQGCPAYMLNLHCPLSSYDLTFESSKTVVEFKDWAFVLSFIKKVVCHIWEQIPACSLFGESHKQISDTSRGIAGEGDTDVFTPDASVTSELANEEYGFHSHQNSLCQSPFFFSKELPLRDHNVYNGHRGSSRRLNGKTSEIKLCGSATNYGDQIDYFSKRKASNLQDISGFRYDEIVPPIKPCRSETNCGLQIDYFSKRRAYNLQDISGFCHNDIISSKSKTHPSVSESSFYAGSGLLSDQIVEVDKKDDCLLVSDGESDLKNDSKWNRSTCHLYQNKSQVHNVPFLLRCSRGLDVLGMKNFSVEKVPANSTRCSEYKDLGIEFEERESFPPYDSFVVDAFHSGESSEMLDAYYSGESSDTPNNIPCQEKFDHFQSSFGSIKNCQDKTASTELSTDFTQSPGYCGSYCPGETSTYLRRVNHIIEDTFTCQLSYSDEFPGSPKSLSSCFFMTDDDSPCNVRSEKNYNSFIGLASRQHQTSKLVDRFEDNIQGSSRKMFSIINCKDDELCFTSQGISHQNHPSHKIKLEKVACSGINDKTAWLSYNSPISKNSSDYSKHADDLPNQEYTDGTSWESSQYCRFSRSSDFRSRRSCSAPPFYKHRSKYSTIYDYSKNIKAKCQPGQYSDDDSAFSGSTRTLKNLSQACGKSPPYAKSMVDNPSRELLDRTFLGKKDSGNEINMVQTNEGSEEDAPVMEYSNINMTKWRSGDLYPTAVQGSARSHNSFGYVDDILDISSGLLHLAGGSLVPESISRDSLKDAKVLLQVDKKFIPVVAGGILVAIDQHAADERIRLEDLRQKVMSGEGCSITYLDLEQELVLPEIGLQLVQNYGEQIKKWGWICTADVQCSGSFTKNLHLLKKQSCRIGLLAVPCILGVNLTDKDLLEYLEQLADTDGTSTMPPSVLRVLNFKACRGAIMFGDALLPSECSLILDELKKTSLCFQCAHGRPTTAPLVNMVELHKHLAKFEMHVEGRSRVWHRLQQHTPSVGRAQERLSSAKRFHNG